MTDRKRPPFMPRIGRKSSGTFVKTTPWEMHDEAILRQEVERRYRERTMRGPQYIEIPWARVTQGELNELAAIFCKKPIPNIAEWEIVFWDWYITVIERNPIHLGRLEGSLCQGKYKNLPLISIEIDDVTCKDCLVLLEDLDAI